MTLVDEMLTFNKQFVDKKEYENYRTDKFPDKKMVILTCMDTRLIELLPKALNLNNGDAKIVKNAGAIVSHPFGSIMRSILVALYELNAKEVFVIGHHGCGMTGLNSASVLEKMRERGIEESTFEMLEHSGIDMKSWLVGFDHVKDGVTNSVKMIKHHPLLPKNTPVHGLIIHPETGQLDPIVNGYE